MGKAKKAIVVASVIIMAFVLIVLWTSQSKATDPLSEWGELYGKSVKTEDGDIIISAKDFSISQETFDNLVAQYQLTSNPEKAEYKAYSELIITRSLYYKAIEEGFLASDDVVRASIEEDSASIKEADNYSDFQKFISASGMTEEEYWTSMEETYRRTITLQNYCEHIQKKFVEEGKQADDIDQWREYCTQCTQKAIENQNVELKHKNAWEFSRENFNYDNYWPHSPVQ